MLAYKIIFRFVDKFFILFTLFWSVCAKAEVKTRKFLSKQIVYYISYNFRLRNKVYVLAFFNTSHRVHFICNRKKLFFRSSSLDGCLKLGKCLFSDNIVYRNTIFAHCQSFATTILCWWSFVWLVVSLLVRTVTHRSLRAFKLNL